MENSGRGERREGNLMLLKTSFNQPNFWEKILKKEGDKDLKNRTHQMLLPFIRKLRSKSLVPHPFPRTIGDTYYSQQYLKKLDNIQKYSEEFMKKMKSNQQMDFDNSDPSSQEIREVGLNHENIGAIQMESFYATNPRNTIGTNTTQPEQIEEGNAREVNLELEEKD